MLRTVILAIAFLPPVAGAADAVRAVRGGRPATLASPARVADSLIAELESCSVNSARWGRAADMWEHALGSDSFVHATYDPPRRVTLHAQDNQRRVEHEVSEILLPLPENSWPAHDLARIGGEAYAFTKCDPVRLLDIVREPGLDMAEIHPYKSLVDAMRR